ncbi:MAG: hypothetical protein ACLR23_12710 [Clostridia bacterium]
MITRSYIVHGNRGGHSRKTIDRKIELPEEREATAEGGCERLILELVVEMYCRRVEFERMDLYLVSRYRFQITEDGRLLRHSTLQGHGCHGSPEYRGGQT